MGKLIVIDGLDGSGKSTQSDLVAQALTSQGKRVKQISFPDYNQPSSALVKMYLSGVFSENPDDVNAYAAGSFYAVDRYASYKQFWEKDYRDGGLILATRYATSNAIHQMGKLPETEWKHYLQWIEDLVSQTRPACTGSGDFPRYEPCSRRPVAEPAVSGR